MGKKTILILTENNYPNGDAGAIRQHFFAKIFQSIGYEVMIASLSKGSYLTKEEYDGVNYISFRKPSRFPISKARNYTGFVNRTIRYFSRNAYSFYAILVVNVFPVGLAALKKYCKKNKIRLFHDCVEWYSPEEFKNGKFSVEYQTKKLINTRLIDSQFEVFSISHYLNNYFRNKGIKSIYVPVIMDIENLTPVLTTANERCVFVYAGNPGYKDNISVIIRAMLELDKNELQQMEFKCVGITFDEMVEKKYCKWSELKELGDSIRATGRISRKGAIDELSHADYSLLFRNQDLTYAKAGFPTKVVESMSVGTPLVMNYSSDLQLYLTDEHNAIISPSSGLDDVKSTIKRALELKNKPCYMHLRQEAYMTAKNNFDFRLFIGKFKSFVESDVK